ncbi:MAG: polysaccharide pyruvyl transferase family protein [Oscillospiraceae bacterium]|nr:polysaccharide pyruvyl transferase family protein [Oscillospiraceae bacterium]
MKKVGIATMTGGANYGNVLQNYAVQTLIERCGYQALTLNNQTKRGFPDSAAKKPALWRKLMPDYLAAYRRTKLGSRYGCKNARDCHGTGLRTAKRRKAQYDAAKQRRMARFDACRERVIHTDPVAFDASRLPREHLAEFAAFVCGSDQVWNPYFHTNSMIEFLQFAPERKRIALAPSFGISQLPECRKRDFSEWIASIPHLSVREDAGAKLIKGLTGRDSKVLLDPTFALTADDWRTFAREPEQKPQGEYVFCYFLGNEINRYVRYIEQYAKRNNCEIVNICDIRDLRYYDIDPQEFVWLLDHARAIFTDSFHGTAFSINLQKPFVVFERVEGGSSMSSRISSVLKKTGLEDRQFPKVLLPDVDSCDFTKASSVVSAEREITVQFLQTALADADTGNIKPVLASRAHCTGCGACEAACPTGAIRMEADAEGFLYPRVDITKCVGCLACERSCPADCVTPADKAPEAYYAFAKDAEICQSSSSGGVFTLLSQEILQRDGAVFGAGFDSDFRVRHQRIDKPEEIARLRTSKYVQSDLGDTLRQVRSLLKENRPVLFSGTPCQIAALRQYLGKDDENLFTQDIICHGVPSPEVWKDYLEQTHGDKQIASVNFRDKTLGWYGFSMKVTYADGAYYRELATKDPYERSFLANLTLRPSCYQCQYKSVSRVSDLTLADYWGVELVHPELKQQQGVSLVLAHSEKGKRLLDAIAKEFQIGSTDLERATKMNHATTHSVSWHPNRNEFFQKRKEEPFAALTKRLLRPTAAQRAKRVVKRSGSRVKKLIKKIRGK